MKKFFIIIILLIIILFLFMINLHFNNVIKIGFSSSLNNYYASITHKSLYGLRLAFDEVDNKIAGTKIILDVKNNFNDLKINKKNIEYFKNNNYNIIICNAPDKHIRQTNQLLEDTDTILLTTVSKIDCVESKKFIKFSPSIQVEDFNELSKYLKSKKLNNVKLIIPNEKIDFVDEYVGAFEKSYKNFNSKAKIQELKVKNINYNNYDFKNTDAFFLIANSKEVANLIQNFRLKGVDKQLICPEWSKSDYTIKNSGRSVDDVIFLTTFYKDVYNKKYFEFREKFIKKYAMEPNDYAIYGYIMGKALIKALRQCSYKNLKCIKEKILNIKKFDLFNENYLIYFNKNKQVLETDYFLIKIQDGEEVRISL